MSGYVIRMEPIRIGRQRAKLAADFSAIGRRIIAGRLVVGLRATDLAAAVGVGTNVLAMWEGGARRPTIDHGTVLTTIFGVTLEWLYLGDDKGIDWHLRENLMRAMTQVEALDSSGRRALRPTANC